MNPNMLQTAHINYHLIKTTFPVATYTPPGYSFSGAPVLVIFHLQEEQRASTRRTMSDETQPGLFACKLCLGLRRHSNIKCWSLIGGGAEDVGFCPEFLSVLCRGMSLCTAVPWAEHDGCIQAIISYSSRVFHNGSERIRREQRSLVRARSIVNNAASFVALLLKTQILWK